VRVWDLQAGTLLHTLTGHDGGVSSVAVSADGRRAVSGSTGGLVWVWDLDAATLLYTFEAHAGLVNSVAVSAYGGSRRVGRQARDVVVSDRTRNAAVRVSASGQAAWLKARNSLSPGLVSIRRSISRLMKKSRP